MAEYTVTVTGTTRVRLDSLALEELVQPALEEELGSDFELGHFSVRDDVTVAVDWQADVEIELDEDSLEQLVREKVEQLALDAGLPDFNIEDVE